MASTRCEEGTEKVQRQDYDGKKRRRNARSRLRRDMQVPRAIGAIRQVRQHRNTMGLLEPHSHTSLWQALCNHLPLCLARNHILDEAFDEGELEAEQEDIAPEEPEPEDAEDAEPVDAELEADEEMKEAAPEEAEPEEGEPEQGELEEGEVEEGDPDEAHFDEAEPDDEHFDDAGADEGDPDEAAPVDSWAVFGLDFSSVEQV